MNHEPQNPALTSPDHRIERLEAIKRLYPDLFTDEGKLNIEEVHALTHNFDVSLGEKFEFRWPGKMHAKKHAFTPSKARLAPDMERSVDFDKTQNVIIEGENLEVLKLLSKSYYNKVKCIYIDPPYNTGHDFVYSDDYSEGKQAYWEKNGVFRDGVTMDTNTESAGRYHTNWLNMMMPRLLLAQMMLKDDGVIFVSIDDNEVHNLRKLMDEVFGEENFVAQFVWQRKGSPKGVPPKNMLVTTHEYIVCYVKMETFSFIGEKRSAESFSNPDDDSREPWRNTNLRSTVKASSQAFEIVDPNTGNIFIDSWAFSRDEILRMVKENRLIFPKSSSGQVRMKEFFSEFKNENIPIISTLGLFDGQKVTQDLESLLGSKVFDNPKSVDLLSHLVGSVIKEGLIIDFFAGSGATAHASMKLNKEDGGKRKFIMIQIPEATDENSEAFKAGYKKISDITIERVKRAGQKIAEENPNVDTGFKVFKLTTSIFPENTYQPDPEKSEDENVKAFQEHLERARQQLLFDPKNKETDLQYEMLIKQGFTLTMSKKKLNEFTDNNVWKVTDGDRSALVCLDADLKESTIKALEGQKDIRFIGLHRAVDTTRKWELTQIFGESLVLF